MKHRSTQPRPPMGPMAMVLLLGTLACLAPLFPADATTPILSERGVIVHALARGRCLCIFNTGYDEGAYWFLLEGTGRNRLLGKNLSRLAEVQQVTASADGKYLAVYSVGEGHPLIEVIDLNALCSDGKYDALQLVDPYPGTVTIVKWSGAKLILRSDMALASRRPEDGRVPDGEILPKTKRFILDMQSGKIEETPIPTKGSNK